MTTPTSQDDPRRQRAIDVARHLIETGNDPEQIRQAVLECFEAGVPEMADQLLKHFADDAAIAQSPWFIRFESWLDAADAEERLDRKQPDALRHFAPDNSQDVRDLARRLRNASQFGLSRRLLARLAGERDNPLAKPAADSEQQAAFARSGLGDDYRKIIHDLSLSTYKDLDIDPARALAEAERLLDKIGLHAADCADPETLGQGGAIYKRRWELTGRMEHLQQSLAFYRKGWDARDEDNRRRDVDAYCGDNAAFVLDLLAKRIDSLNAAQASAWREEAGTIRKTFVAELEPQPNKNTWTLASLADGYFALGNYDKASEYYARANEAMDGDWQRKTMFLQAVQLARAQDIPLPATESGAGKFDHPAWNAIQPILGEKTTAALAGFRPKTGLALSGGGFRAAFYHLGVLARLADIDALRHVEVISTVSGGSIVGTHYFLKLKALLEEKGDEVTAQDYRQLVRDLISEFRTGVEQNLRMRAFVSVCALWRTLWRLDYNRTLRLGELYDKYFYANVLGKISTTLRDLIVSPQGETRAFSPRQDNWLRRAKVPILLINATNLNSGHSWQFAGSFMGEPPGLVEAEIDANERYARVHLDKPEVPLKWREFPLGSAVAASSAVPGLFNPVPLVGLYDERDVQLADGGIYDNQGVDTLLQENCSLILCSDASGQLDDDKSPPTLFLGVLKRANNITMERDRIIEYQDLRSRLENRALNGMLFMHLRQGLDIWRVAPTCDPPDANQSNVATSTRTDYCVDKDIQRLLSRIRTDLDSFSEVEADALMLSGYLATGKQIEEQQNKMPAGDHWGGFDTPAFGNDDWPFLDMATYICATPGQQDAKTAARVTDVRNQLAASSNLFAKPLYLSIGPKATKLLLWVFGLGIVALAVGGIRRLTTCMDYWWVLWVLLVAAIPFVALMVRGWNLNWQRALQRVGELAVAIAVWPIAAISLWPSNRLFLNRGSRKRMQCIK